MKFQIMKLIQTIEKLERLDILIWLQITGKPRELARKLGISQSTLFLLFHLAKKLGAQITYNPSSCTYQYTKPMRFVAGFFEVQDEPSEKKQEVKATQTAP
jgi:hypothetical protein